MTTPEMTTVFVGIDRNWSMRWLAGLNGYLEVDDSETLETLYDMTATFLYWRHRITLQGNSPWDTASIISETLQGYGVTHIPVHHFSAAWRELYELLIPTLLVILPGGSFSTFGPTLDSNGALSGFCITFPKVSGPGHPGA